MRRKTKIGPYYDDHAPEGAPDPVKGSAFAPEPNVEERSQNRAIHRWLVRKQHSRMGRREIAMETAREASKEPPVTLRDPRPMPKLVLPEDWL